MKLRTSHHASLSWAAPTSLLGKSLIVLAIVIFAFIAPFQSVQKVAADQYDDKINALQQDINQYQAQATELNKQAVTLQSTLAQLANEKAALQAQIDINQVKYDQLIINIAATEKNIADNKDALGKTIADLYVDQKISPLEMLASSKNISDYLDKQEYRNSVRDQLTDTIKEIKDLKAKLDKQKTDVETILAEQKTARDSLVAKENEQQNLLARTQNNEAAYQSLIGSRSAQIAEARAMQALLNTRGTSTGGFKVFNSGILLAYVTDNNYGSWNNGNCAMNANMESTGGVSYSRPPYNGEDGRGYGCRQCASYVAWKIVQVKYGGDLSKTPSWGNASNFANHGTATSPHAGAIAVIGGNPGHVAWVESDPYISTSGPLQGRQVIVVSQYNFNYGQGAGMYSVMELSVNFFDSYRDI